MKNYYEELEVSKNASDEVINRAYKVLAKKYHPDTTTVDKQLAEERFKKISEAYETLSNKQKREAYDKTLTPDVDINKYNKMLHSNYSNPYQNINYTQKNYNTNPQYQKNSYSFFDELKYKFNELFKKGISLLLTIGIIFITISILYLIPSTRNFIINDLHLGILFRIFK